MGGEGIQTEPAELRSYADYLGSSTNVFDTIRQYVHSTACDKSGFTGLLALLTPGVDLVESLFDKTLDFGKEKLQGAAGGMHDTADTYEHHDTNNAQMFSDISDAMGDA